MFIKVLYPPDILESGGIMHSEYIELRNGGYYVAGTRISLDSVVYAFNRGDSPERILEEFPLLEKGSRVYGAIAFYLDHKVEIDKYLERTEREFEASGFLSKRRTRRFGRRSNVPRRSLVSPTFEH